MDNATFTRTRRTVPFVQVANALVRSDKLSYCAKGIMTMLLSHSDDWNISFNDIRKHTNGKRGEGRDGLYSAIKELIEAGYITRHQKRNGTRFSSYSYQVFDEPQGKELEPKGEERTVNGFAVYGEGVSGSEEQKQEHEEVKTRKPTKEKELSVNGSTVYGEGVYIRILNKENTNPKDQNIEPHEKFLDFVNFWNSEKNPLWASCEKLNQQRVNLLRRLIKDEGTSALEIFQKAVKFGRQDKFWCSKRMTIDNILRHTRELADKYLETPNGHVISDSDLSMAARMKESQELAEHLAKKFNYNGVNN